MAANLLTTEIRFEPDIVLARQRARQIAALIGFDTLEQTQIATAVSEIARNAFQYAGSGTVRFTITTDRPCRFEIHIADRGAGIADIQAILEGRYVSRTGLGRGIVGAKRLMDHFEITSQPHVGTTVLLARRTPPPFTPTAAQVQRISGALTQAAPQSAFQEVQNQNQELLRALEEGRIRQAEAERLNAELEETNRGVMALVAELDEKARALQYASEMKSRFLSNMSHEIRTPINAILSLSRLLLDRADGELTDEQAKQVGFIRSSGGALAELIGDLLDIARIEAGKSVLRPHEFTVYDVWGALRGMFRPLHTDPRVELIFEEPGELPPFLTDEGKVAQILRNFISNALKFTVEGTVRVAVSLEPTQTAESAAHETRVQNGLAQVDPAQIGLIQNVLMHKGSMQESAAPKRFEEQGARVRFTVTDTGIGIARADHERIFEEFTQLENGMQRYVKGTGLGLSLTRRLAHLLGGHVGVQSEPDRGALFYAVIPLVCPSQAAADAETPSALEEPSAIPSVSLPDQPLTGQTDAEGAPLRAPQAKQDAPLPRFAEEGRRA